MTVSLDVSRQSPLPLYYQIREILRQELVERKLPPGAPLASESKLIERFGVSRTTIRKALDDLVVEGLIHRAQGQGTFVRDQPIEHELTGLTSFVEDMVALGYHPSTRVIKAITVPASEGVAHKLALAEDTEVAYIERVRMANDAPISFNQTWLPLDVGLPIISEDLASCSVYSLLEDKHGVELTDADYRIEAAQATGPVAAHLEVVVGSPILLVERLAYVGDHGPVDFELIHNRADNIRLFMKLKRKHPAWHLDNLVLDQVGNDDQGVEPSE